MVNLPKLTRAILWSLASILAVFFIGLAYLYFTEPTASPENVRISNITDSSASVSWTTEKPTHAFVFWSQKDWPLVLPYFWRFFTTGAADEVESLSTVHHVTVSGLEPQQSYRFLITTGVRAYYSQTGGQGFPLLTTGKILENPTTPYPAYGKITREDGIFPAEQALIYLTAQNSSGLSLSLSTITNLDGNWALDLSNLRASTGEQFVISEDATLTMETTHPQLGSATETFQIGQHSPAPLINLSGEE